MRKKTFLMVILMLIVMLILSRWTHKHIWTNADADSYADAYADAYAPVVQMAYMPLRRDLFCLWSDFFFEKSPENIGWFRYSWSCIKKTDFFLFFLKNKKRFLPMIFTFFPRQIPRLGQEEFIFLLLILFYSQAMLPSFEIAY